MSDWYHVLTPFAGDSSASHSVVRNLSRAAAGLGVRSHVLVAHNRPQTFPDAEIIPIDYREHVRQEYLTDTELREDMVRGALGLKRRWSRKLYAPIIPKLQQLNGPIIIHQGHLGEDVPRQLRDAGVRAPIFLYCHTVPSRSYRGRELAAACRAADGVIAVSHSLLGAIRGRIGQRHGGNNFTVVHNAADTTLFHPPAEEPKGSGPLRVLFVGVVHEHKGPHLILEALSLLPAGSSIATTFVGSGHRGGGGGLTDYEQRLRLLAESAAGEVSFVPYVQHNEVAELYRRADVVVTPSQFDEPFALVSLEALASGCAIASTNRGGLPEAFGEAAQYFATPAELAAILGALSTEAESLRNWRAKAFERSAAFSWHESARSLHDFVEATARRPGTHPISADATAHGNGLDQAREVGS